jgi:hypothetical protein
MGDTLQAHLLIVEFLIQQAVHLGLRPGMKDEMQLA